LFHQRLAIPKNAEGRYLTINVGGGDDLALLERRMMPGRFVAHNFQQLLSLLQERRRNDFIYYQLRQPDQGLIIEGEQLSSLPPSVYSIMQSQNLKGNASFIREQILAETRQQISLAAATPKNEKDAPYAVTGLKTLRLKLRSN
jgi:hypothetical protein